jgi:hypothetical protein
MITRVRLQGGPLDGYPARLSKECIEEGLVEFAFCYESRDGAFCYVEGSLWDNDRRRAAARALEELPP